MRLNMRLLPILVLLLAADAVKTTPSKSGWKSIFRRDPKKGKTSKKTSTVAPIDMTTSSVDIDTSLTTLGLKMNTSLSTPAVLKKKKKSKFARLKEKLKRVKSKKAKKITTTPKPSTELNETRETPSVSDVTSTSVRKEKKSKRSVLSRVTKKLKKKMKKKKKRPSQLPVDLSNRTAVSPEEVTVAPSDMEGEIRVLCDSAKVRSESLGSKKPKSRKSGAKNRLKRLGKRFRAVGKKLVRRLSRRRMGSHEMSRVKREVKICAQIEKKRHDGKALSKLYKKLKKVHGHLPSDFETSGAVLQNSKVKSEHLEKVPTKKDTNSLEDDYYELVKEAQMLR